MIKRIVVSVILLLALGWSYSYPRDSGQWENIDPAVHQWYQNLMRPDSPSASCCTEADAYYADIIHVRDGRVFAVITDDREDAPLGRPHLKVGTEFEVPPEKLKWDSSNPTGHNVLFVSVSGYTWCFVQSS